MAAIEFENRLVGTGWSKARLVIDGQSIDLTASYLEGVLSDLLWAVWLVAAGDATARASWAEEPGEYRWLLDHADDQLRVRILALADIEALRRSAEAALAPVSLFHISIMLDGLRRRAQTRRCAC